MLYELEGNISTMSITIPELPEAGNSDDTSRRSPLKPIVVEIPHHESDCSMSFYTSFLKAQSDTITEYLSLLHRHEDLCPPAAQHSSTTASDRLGGAER
jgi:hypothetical protein